MSLFKYGSFSFEPGECNLVKSEKSVINSHRGKRLLGVYRMMLDVVVQKNTVQEITDRVNAIVAAFNSNYQDATLYTDDAGFVLSAHQLVNSNSLSGVRVIRGPTFKAVDGAEYANKRTSLIVLEATYDESDGDLVSWKETLRFFGTGGPDYAVLPGWTGPTAFPLGPNTPQLIVQTGEAIGFTAPVAPPGPLLPLYPAAGGVYLRAQAQEEGYDSALCQGQDYRFFPSNWRYVMESLTAQTGFPTTR